VIIVVEGGIDTVQWLCWFVGIVDLRGGGDEFSFHWLQSH